MTDAATEQARLGMLLSELETARREAVCATEKSRIYAAYLAVLARWQRIATLAVAS